jgi:RHH-type transcriptional regulator, proline utilization regulon repressor / proline dehydrogenase / delta 1-pyrroline-5-carboxylate dehydrogenase
MTVVEELTQSLGRSLIAKVDAYRPSIGELAGDRAMVMLATRPHLRSHLLRFVDALAGLGGDWRGTETARLLREYLGGDFAELPPAFVPMLEIATSGLWPSPLVAQTARLMTRSVASRFIVSGGTDGVTRALEYLRNHRRYPSFDVLGEYVAGWREADRYRDRYLDLIDFLGRSHGAGVRSPSGAFQLQISLKLSALTPEFDPVDPEGTETGVRPRLAAIIQSAMGNGIGVTFDMERFETRDLVLRIFLDTFGPNGPYPHWEGAGVVLQAYLRDAGDVATELAAFARHRGTPFQIRLVKGAYWDYETIVAGENGWPSPVWEEKWRTDQAYEQLTETLIAAVPNLYLAIASHNIRSHAHAEAVRELAGLSGGAIEHQTLYKTAEGIARALTTMGWPVRDYVPVGELLPGMAYLVRRILENSSQAGFLLHSRSGESAESLLAGPLPAAR